MKLYHKAFLYRHKWIQPYLQKVLGGIDAVTFLAALALIGGVVYEHGFIISEGAEADLGVLYRTVWGVFLVQTTMHIGLAYRETLKKYRTFLNNRIFQLILLLLLSLLRLSSGVIGLLGKRTNPSLILAGSFFLIICIGTGLLMLPRCTVDGISWVNALFVSTSAVCVTDQFRFFVVSVVDGDLYFIFHFSDRRSRDVGLVPEYSRYFGDDGATGNGVCCFSFYFGFL